MKKIIAIVALIASVQASAFWGWNDGHGNGDGYVDGTGGGDAAAEADFSFDMTFSARIRGEGYGRVGRGPRSVYLTTCSGPTSAP